MATFKDAVKRLQIIYNECNPQAKGNREADKNLDDFTRLKKQIHQDIKSVRQMLEEREELLKLKPGSKDVAETSHKIRSKIKLCREDAMKMQSLLRKDEAKKSISAEQQDINKRKADTIQLIFQHIEEVENLEKKRFTDKVSADRSQLFAGAANVKIEMANFTSKPADTPYQSNLPDIDDDPEVSQGLKMLDKNNRDIDNDLDIIRSNVGQLKEIAINMDQELNKQNAMLDVIENKVDKAQAHLDNINVKLKDNLEKVMKGDKFLVNCVLFTIILSLAGFIGSYFIP